MELESQIDFARAKSKQVLTVNKRSWNPELSTFRVMTAIYRHEVGSDDASSHAANAKSGCSYCIVLYCK